MGPTDRYTPHGYLDNPFHTRNLNPSGVIRSSLGVGFAWHYPALARGYGFREIYRASLNLALTVDGETFFLQEHFADLHADVHSMNVFRYRGALPGLGFSATFHRIGEHTLACRLRLVPAERQSLKVRVTAFSAYTRHLGAAGVWGESGLVGRREAETIVLQGFEDGEAFALGAEDPPAAAGAQETLDPAWLAEPTLAGDHAVVTGRRGESVTLHGAVAYDLHSHGDRPLSLDLFLSRGIRRDLALRELQAAPSRKHEALAQLAEDDRKFWRGAPALAGDWPDHWRRGAVYDLETLRMMVRRPVGIYRHVWDAMQIQAPRVVLAEAAIDALLLAYADPGTARALLLGTFLDAPQANIPCSREDGSYNMVGANGSECGTAPEWGYPLMVAEHLYHLDPEPAWLAAIFPRLAAFLEWWLAHRRDEAGYLVYDNSWESGQDLSARFGPQKEGGGSTIRVVRPVDLQAAMAAACRTMTRFAEILGRESDHTLWQERFEHFRALTDGLWHEGEYRDYDARVGWSDVWDVMQLAPVALGLADEAKREALRSRVRQLDQTPYLWPMFVWTATEAALRAGEPGTAADIAFDTIDRAYGYWDRAGLEEGRPLPGVTCEYWGTDGQCGAEGYGWGAFGLHLLFRTLVGFKPLDEAAFELRPNLPDSLLVVGRRYEVHRLNVGGVRFNLAYLVGEEGIGVELRTGDAALFGVEGHAGREIRFAAQNRTAYRIDLRADPYGPTADPIATA